jgi:hypothetical protein
MTRTPPEREHPIMPPGEYGGGAVLSVPGKPTAGQPLDGPAQTAATVRPGRLMAPAGLGT